MTIRYLHFLLLFLALGFSAGCHEDSDDEDENSEENFYAGRFSDDPVQGVFYEVLESNSVSRSGRTDPLGSFRYPRDRASRVVFFLGDDAADSDDRLELGGTAITRAEASTEGLTLTPADLSGNVAIVQQVAAFLQGLHSNSDTDRIVIANELHSRIIMHDAVQSISGGPYVAGTGLLADFPNLPAAGEDYPALTDAIARLQAAQRCHAAGVYRYSDSDDSGTFALPASLPVNSIYGLSDAGLDIRGAFRSTPLPADTDLSFAEIDTEAGTRRDFTGRFARDYRSIARTSPTGPMDVQRLSDTPLTDLRWRMVSTATGSVLLEMNFHADGSISGVRVDADTDPTGTPISGEYTGGDDLSQLALMPDPQDSSGTYTSLSISGLEATLEFTPAVGGGRTSFTADLCRP